MGRPAVAVATVREPLAGCSLLMDVDPIPIPGNAGVGVFGADCGLRRRRSRWICAARSCVPVFRLELTIAFHGWMHMHGPRALQCGTIYARCASCEFLEEPDGPVAHPPCVHHDKLHELRCPVAGICILSSELRRRRLLRTG